MILLVIRKPLNDEEHINADEPTQNLEISSGTARPASRRQRANHRRQGDISRRLTYRSLMLPEVMFQDQPKTHPRPGGAESFPVTPRKTFRIAGRFAGS